MTEEKKRETQARLAPLRKEYTKGDLDLAGSEESPFVQFESWMNDAIKAGLEEPNAMTLATATRDGRPSARTVLLKSYDERGFVFYTNYDSRKGEELEANPFAALLFYWEALERQIRIEGRVSKTSRADSERYFAARPIGSQVSAACSPQSNPIASRAVLEAAVEKLASDLAGKPPACPAEWGGYRVEPSKFEFWQGRQNRLHDRIEYTPISSGGWQRHRLAP